MLDVHRLRLLRELDRRGTLASVARAMSYSPSAISQQLAQLETEAGVQLLEHVGRGVRLTGPARLLVAHTDAILERLEQAEADLVASRTDITGTLRVASFQSVMLALVPSALSLLAGRYPTLRVEIVHREVEPAFAGLLAHEFDLVLGEVYPGMPQTFPTGVSLQDLVHDELRLALPTHGRWASATRLADLADAPWILDPGDSPAGAWARAVCRAAGFEPDIRFDSTDLLLAVHLAESGHAVALLPDLLWHDRAHRLRLRRLPGRPKRRLFSGVRSGAARHPAIRTFREGLRDGLNEIRAGAP